MTSVPGVDHPAEQGEATVTLVDRNITVGSRVEVIDGGTMSVLPSTGSDVEQAVVTTGDRVEVFWKGPADTRSLPAQVLDVEQGDVTRWRLQITGPAEVTQRRTAVRGRLTIDVTLRINGVELKGETIDLSENGLRASFEGSGREPEPGQLVDVVLYLEDGELRTRATVVRLQVVRAVWLMSVHLLDMDDRDHDRIRRRVFQALREERARLNA